MRNLLCIARTYQASMIGLRAACPEIMVASDRELIDQVTKPSVPASIP